MRSIVHRDRDGYELLVDPDVPKREARTIAHHRVLAYAWGLIESPLRDSREIHHEIAPDVNVEGALRAMSKPEHTRLTFEISPAGVVG